MVSYLPGISVSPKGTPIGESSHGGSRKVPRSRSNKPPGKRKSKTTAALKAREERRPPRSENRSIALRFFGRGAFAAIREDGLVISWGHPKLGGNSSKVQAPQIEISGADSSSNFWWKVEPIFWVNGFLVSLKRFGLVFGGRSEI